MDVIQYTNKASSVVYIPRGRYGPLYVAVELVVEMDNSMMEPLTITVTVRRGEEVLLEMATAPNGTARWMAPPGQGLVHSNGEMLFDVFLSTYATTPEKYYKNMDTSIDILDSVDLDYD
jgi:hypothetical protein